MHEQWDSLEPIGCYLLRFDITYVQLYCILLAIYDKRLGKSLECINTGLLLSFKWRDFLSHQVIPTYLMVIF